MLRLQSIDPEKNRWRTYTIDLQPTLFGNVSLVTQWGRIGSDGQQKVYHFSNRDEALRKIRQLVRRRRRHGYELTEGGRSLVLMNARNG